VTILNVKNLSCGYSDRQVIKEISFSVREGEFLGIVGPNGAGKTTLFRAVTGLLRPWNGVICYKGQNVRKMSLRSFAQEVAVIPQIPDIPFAFSVEEFVSMGRFPHRGRFGPFRKEDKELIEGALSLADISSIRNRAISELSGGELQRVAIAQGFAQKPRLLLLDEPIAHLDIAHQVAILDLIKKLNRENHLTIITVLHDLNIASSYCDRLILLKSGTVFRDGPPQEVLTYQNIEEVYNTVVVVKENPISRKPYIILVTEQDQRKRNQQVR